MQYLRYRAVFHLKHDFSRAARHLTVRLSKRVSKRQISPQWASTLTNSDRLKPLTCYPTLALLGMIKNPEAADS